MSNFATHAAPIRIGGEDDCGACSSQLLKKLDGARAWPDVLINLVLYFGEVNAGHFMPIVETVPRQRAAYRRHQRLNSRACLGNRHAMRLRITLRQALVPYEVVKSQIE